MGYELVMYITPDSISETQIFSVRPQNDEESFATMQEADAAANAIRSAARWGNGEQMFFEVVS